VQNVLENTRHALQSEQEKAHTLEASLEKLKKEKEKLQAEKEKEVKKVLDELKERETQLKAEKEKNVKKEKLLEEKNQDLNVQLEKQKEELKKKFEEVEKEKKHVSEMKEKMKKMKEKQEALEEEKKEKEKEKKEQEEERKKKREGGAESLSRKQQSKISAMIDQHRRLSIPQDHHALVQSKEEEERKKKEEEKKKKEEEKKKKEEEKKLREEEERKKKEEEELKLLLSPSSSEVFRMIMREREDDTNEGKTPSEILREKLKEALLDRIDQQSDELDQLLNDPILDRSVSLVHAGPAPPSPHPHHQRLSPFIRRVKSPVKPYVDGERDEAEEGSEGEEERREREEKQDEEDGWIKMKSEREEQGGEEERRRKEEEEEQKHHATQHRHHLAPPRKASSTDGLLEHGGRLISSEYIDSYRHAKQKSPKVVPDLPLDLFFSSQKKNKKEEDEEDRSNQHPSVALFTRPRRTLLSLPRLPLVIREEEEERRIEKQEEVVEDGKKKKITTGDRDELKGGGVIGGEASTIKKKKMMTIGHGETEDEDEDDGHLMKLQASQVKESFSSSSIKKSAPIKSSPSLASFLTTMKKVSQPPSVSSRSPSPLGKQHRLSVLSSPMQLNRRRLSLSHEKDEEGGEATKPASGFLLSSSLGEKRVVDEGEERQEGQGMVPRIEVKAASPKLSPLVSSSILRLSSPRVSEKDRKPLLSSEEERRKSRGLLPLLSPSSLSRDEIIQRAFGGVGGGEQGTSRLSMVSSPSSDVKKMKNKVREEDRKDGRGYASRRDDLLLSTERLMRLAQQNKRDKERNLLPKKDRSYMLVSGDGARSESTSEDEEKKGARRRRGDDPIREKYTDTDEDEEEGLNELQRIRRAKVESLLLDLKLGIASTQADVALLKDTIQKKNAEILQKTSLYNTPDSSRKRVKKKKKKQTMLSS
ncbi:hypothetical protein CSUI_010523, partial [Cystoisospora suis]